MQTPLPISSELAFVMNLGEMLKVIKNSIYEIVVGTATMLQSTMLLFLIRANIRIHNILQISLNVYVNQSGLRCIVPRAKL